MPATWAAAVALAERRVGRLLGRLRARCGGVRPAARPEALKAIGRLIQSPAAEAPRVRHARGAGGVQEKLAAAVAEEAARHPGEPVEALATDAGQRRCPADRAEADRAGPGRRGAGAPSRSATTATSGPTSSPSCSRPAFGETFWHLSSGISEPFFEAPIALSAREAGAGRGRRIVLVLDNAGWRTEPGLAVPDGVGPVHLPPHGPELQPAERLWPLLDEPLVNKRFATLAEVDRSVASGCLDPEADRDTVKARTRLRWWPEPRQPA